MKLKIKLSNNFMEIQMGGGSLNLEIVREGRSSSFRNSGGSEGEGSKNRACRRRGVYFFWNNPFLICFVRLFVVFSFPNWLLSLLS